MKKGFTLIELLIVVVVLVTLMTVMFRIGGVGEESTKRNNTINRMQRLENCLSGYYAAFGSYPPVKLHGSRDYLLPTDAYGLQDLDAAHETELNWTYVEAACKSQPLSFGFPFQPGSQAEYMNARSRLLQENKTNPEPKDSFYALENNGTVTGKQKKKHWKDVQLFKFGLMSYLLPRYLVTMRGASGSGNNIDYQLFDKQEQWRANNQLPSRFESGVPYNDWREVRDEIYQNPWKIAVLPSQAVCARWLPNLEKTVSTMFSRELYGIEIRSPDEEGVSMAQYEVYDASANGSGGKGSNGSGQNYALNLMTVVDGWGQEFYYYSLPPHQSYTLWSGGKNKKTFPPWVDMNKVDQKHRKTIQDWVSDDIMQMSN